jgi:hypothetical protein
MFRVGITGCAIAALLLADGFTFTIGSPVAAQDYQVKAAAFVFRTDGCAEPAKPQVNGTAEGLVRGMRQSVLLKIVETAKPGVNAVIQTWPQEGRWVVSLKGTCGGSTAGAIVPVGPRGFIREASKLLAHPPAEAEIEAALKAVSTGEPR